MGNVEFSLRMQKKVARPRVLVADPPWPFDDRLPGGGRGAEKHYENSKGKMSIDDIRCFDIPRMADSAILFMWRVGAMAGLAEEVCRAWGFEPKSELVWRKWRVCSECAGEGGKKDPMEDNGWSYCPKCEGHQIAAKGPSVVPHTGMGHYVRWSHETCIIASRGKMLKKINTDVHLSVLDALVPLVPGSKKVKHSAKPPEFFALVEKMYAGPYVELFSRNERKGWRCMGDEVQPLRA